MHVKKGLEQLQDADKYQKSARPMKCMLVLMVLIGAWGVRKLFSFAGLLFIAFLSLPPFGSHHDHYHCCAQVGLT